ncbi:RagB/SusD family nutrient uptake outer membrane protein [Dysgonomonas sp. UBA7698]|uniref:RagB/SusD family nutrient uptake outer membrane protein n=1 Tax=Dysgonomonas sp. UBA7698 TaxID=1946427 RepID=UPI0025B88ABC|nr:RagB/SusD family nutrient uptake outer membrane protein [Dysgonomonas sp. UBA7698]
MIKNITKNLIAVSFTAMIMLGTFSCLDDLDRFPTNDITSKEVYKSLAGHKSVMAKVYGAYAMTGNSENLAEADIVLGDGSSPDFLRTFFNLQSLTTEEAINGWTDNGITDLNFNTWSASNANIQGLYIRSMYQITVANEYLRESTDSKLAEYGISDANDIKEIQYFRAEARFIRAFQYWVLMDLFGNPPFVDENSPVGKFLPPQIKRADLFNYIESELLDIETKLKDAKQNEYGRADKAACWSLLARMYLNAKVYTGVEKYTQAATFSKKVIGSGYSLKPSYEELFLADNHLNNPEVILSINYDGQKTKGYGGMTFLINSSFKPTREDISGVNYQTYYGMGGQGGWFGNRTRPQLYQRFTNNDGRKLFIGTKADVDEIARFEDGMSIHKFRNVTSTGEVGSNFYEFFADTDFPLFRLAEMYLIYGEAVLRGGEGSTTDAQTYLNKIRERAFGNTTNNIPLTLDNILDERSRELYWECFRRTDLVRYDLYTSSAHLWQWKGGVKEGIGLPSYMNLFPIPAPDLIANPNLKQNTGY